MSIAWYKRCRQGHWVMAMLLYTSVVWLPLPQWLSQALPDGFLVLMVAALCWRYTPGQYHAVALWGLWVDVISQSALGAHMAFYVLLALLYWHHQKRMLLYTFVQRSVLAALLVLAQRIWLPWMAAFSHHPVSVLGGAWGGFVTWVLLLMLLWYNDRLMAQKAGRLWLA